MKKEKTELQFLGGAGTVTGSKFLVSRGSLKILVDGGLFQGVKNLRQRNWESLPVAAADLSAVLLTHAHLDHSGYLPKLVKDGFRGAIFCTPATFELCRILLMDSAYLMTEEAEYMGHRRISRHDPPLPLYTADDVERTLKLFVPVDFNVPCEIAQGAHAEFFYAGHIMGAAGVLLKTDGPSFFFSGDVGRPGDPVLRAPVPAPPADVLVVESTYGNRIHPAGDPLDDLEGPVRRALTRGGVVMIPAFAVGRAQLLLFLLWRLKEQGRVPRVPTFLNSPMAIGATDLFFKYPALHRLNEAECRGMGRDVEFIRTAEESQALNRRKGPMILISASGMITGGRILHHLKAFAGDPRNMILLTGYQAAGTRGRALLDGAAELKIHGAYVPVRAEIVSLDSLSAHADARELIAWLKSSPGFSPKKVFVVHGEPSASDELRRRFRETFNWDVVVPEPFQVFSWS